MGCLKYQDVITPTHIMCPIYTHKFTSFKKLDKTQSPYVANIIIKHVPRLEINNNNSALENKNESIQKILDSSVAISCYTAITNIIIKTYVNAIPIPR